MPDIIQILPDNIANQIAAGEVIQRPASAVKEIIENSLDAGATKISVVIKNAGKSLIQIVDDGQGMSETDARMSFERHATSKIRKVEDLFSIKTMGFRGEALASIAAVSQLEIKTRKADSDVGTKIYIEGSEVKNQEVCQCAIGTSLSIRNLFYNIPARRNFLKSNTTEFRHILDEFQRLSLANPEVVFTLQNEDSDVYHLTKGNLRQRIVSVFKNSYNQGLVPVEEISDTLKITGFIGKPEIARKTRGEQFFFVNNRFIKNPYLNHAVVNAYDQILPADSFPLYVLFIDLDSSKVDVNVHPTKQEIKFEDERLVYAFVHAAVKHALGQYSVTPTLDFETEQGLDQLQAFSGNRPNTLAGNEGFTNTSYKSQIVDPSQMERFFPVKEAATLQSMMNTDEADSVFIEEDDVKEPYQIHNRFIISPIKSGFIIVDQQAAEERIIFERCINALNNNEQISQQQLFPRTIKLPEGDKEILREILDDINILGLEIQEFGKNEFVLHGLPSDIQVEDELQLVENLLEQYKQNLRIPKLDKREGLARAMAKKAGSLEGKRLSSEEMKNLIDQLFACEAPTHTPSGRLTLISYSLEELESHFEKK